MYNIDVLNMECDDETLPTSTPSFINVDLDSYLSDDSSDSDAECSNNIDRSKISATMIPSHVERVLNDTHTDNARCSGDELEAVEEEVTVSVPSVAGPSIAPPSIKHRRRQMMQKNRAVKRLECKVKVKRKLFETLTERQKMLPFNDMVDSKKASLSEATKMVSKACANVYNVADIYMMEWSEAIILSLADPSIVNNFKLLKWSTVLDICTNCSWDLNVSMTIRTYISKVETLMRLMKNNRDVKRKMFEKNKDVCKLLTDDGPMFITIPWINKRFLEVYRQHFNANPMDYNITMDTVSTFNQPNVIDDKKCKK